MRCVRMKHNNRLENKQDQLEQSQNEQNNTEEKN